MLSSKLNLVLFQILLFLLLPFCFSSCVSKETKIKRLCKKWIYSHKTINEKKDKIAELSKSSSLSEQLAGAMGQGVFKMMETSVFEFEGNGNYIISNAEDGLSVLLTQTGKWEFDGLGTIIITLNNKKERYEIKELTEKTLILSYIKEGQEVVEGFIPFTEIKPVKSKETNISLNDSKINIESFKYSKDIIFGYLIKKEAVDKEYLFVRNDDENENNDVLIKIDGKLINLKLEKEGNISKTLFFQEYKSNEYIVRVEYKANQTSEEYVNTLEATIIITKDGKTKVFENLYAESIFD